MKTIVFDFDGVIHSYISGWKGTAVITDEPVLGIKEAIDSIRSEGYEVVIVSTRTATMEGLSAVTDWLNKYGIVVDAVSAEKPPALVYIDDRAICFDGDPSSLLDKIKTFQPWHKRKRPTSTISRKCRLRNWRISSKLIRDLKGMLAEYDGITITGLIKSLQEAPAVDAEPVRHGKYVLLYDTYGPMVCSECGGEAPSISMGSEYEESQYCPSCGAKMDGKEKEE